MVDRRRVLLSTFRVYQMQDFWKDKVHLGKVLFFAHYIYKDQKIDYFSHMMVLSQNDLINSIENHILVLINAAWDTNYYHLQTFVEFLNVLAIT
jgi:hypothetical protein